MSMYSLPLSEGDTKALVDEATSALNAGDVDKAIELARVLVKANACKPERHHWKEVQALLVHLHPILKKRGIEPYKK